MSLRTARIVVTSLAVALSVGSATAQRPSLDRAEIVEMAADSSAYEPGSRARLAAVVLVEDDWHLQSNTPTFDYLIPTTLELALPDGWPAAEIRYPQHSLWTAEFEEEPLAVYQGEILIFAEIEIPSTATPGSEHVRVRLNYQACDDKQCLPPTEASSEIVLTVGSGGVATHDEIFAASTSSISTSAAPPALSLARILVFGLLGGLILNAMPCVLPVLSLKLFGLVEQAGQGRRATTVGALATASGIIVSFWLLALAAVLARNAGHLIGWGLQFQNPAFVTFLAVVVLLFCLNLWGLFEIPLPHRLATTASGAPRDGVAGHFATGLFATLMATPCSAPFLGSAVGFALGQSGSTIFLVFTAVGVGMALPYLSLAVAPGTMAWLPKPGAWMVYLKTTMGFLLAGAAVWLLYVLAAQVSAERLAFIEVGLLVLSLFVWLTHQAPKPSPLAVAARLGVLAAVAGTMFLSLGAAGGSAQGTTEPTGLIAWTDFDRAQARALADEGRLVFVDVTADWCFTCKANERLVLETETIASAFERHGVIPMRADWTNRSDDIARFLADHGRYSIPFYLLYRPGQEPHLFGEVLRKGQVLAALEESSPKTAIR